MKDYKIDFSLSFLHAILLNVDELGFTSDQAISPKQLQGYWVTQ